MYLKEIKNKLKKGKKMEYFTSNELRIINSDYGTAVRLQQALLNMYNNEAYPQVDLLRIMKSSDKTHLELFLKILKTPLEYFDEQIIKDIEYLQKGNENEK